MPVPNLLIGSIGRLLTAIERRRGLVVLVVAGLLLAIGTSTSLVGRPPLLTPAVEGLTGALMAGLSQPVRLARYLIGSRPSSGERMRLELELAQLRRAEAENRRLRTMVRFPPPEGYCLVAARVTGTDLDPLRGVAWISTGRRAGVREGMPVLTVDGLVGIVDEAGRDRSKVRLLLSEITAVSVRNTRSRAVGVVDWDPAQSLFRVERVPFQADFAEGDTVVSSGLGGVFPPDLPVGTVAKVTEPPERLIKEVELDPFASFQQLEEVFVLAPIGAPGAIRYATRDTLRWDAWGGESP